MLVYIAFVATLTLWIIHFEGADHDPEIVITDSLKMMNIEMLENISDVSIDQTNFVSILQKYNKEEDPYGILSSERSKYDVSVEKHISCANIDEALKHRNEHTYYEIYFTLTKELFFKVTNLTLEDDVKLTVDEMYSILKYLFIYLDDKFCVSCMIYKNMLNNPSLYDQLECRCNEQMDDCTIISVSLMFSSLMMELANHAVLIINDDYGNIAIASANNHEEDRFRIYTKLNEMIGLFPIQHLTVDADFISQNNEFLHNLCVNAGKELTVIVDFTAIKYVQHVNNIVVNKLEELASSTFLQLGYVQVIDIYFSHIIINFNLNFLNNKQINLVCNSCVLSNGIELPKMCDRILLEDCYINNKLLMPENINIVIFRNIVIAENTIVCVNNVARHFEFINIAGCVHIPNINEDLHIVKCSTNWSFKQVKETDGAIEELLIECAVFERTNIDFCQKIKKLVLRNIDLDEQTVVTIRNNVETVHIEGLSGTVHLHDSIVHSGLLVIKFNNGDLFIQDVYVPTMNTKHSMKKHKKLLLRNANIFNEVFFLDDLLEICLVNIILSNSQKSLKLNSNIYAIHLYNCNGSVSFNNIAGLDQIFFVENSNQLFTFNKSLQTGKVALRMESITLHEDVTLDVNVSNISLINVTCTNNGILTICQGYNSLNINNCRGRYRIPGISQNEETIINIPEMYSMTIKFKEMNMYDVCIEHMHVDQPWTINLDINYLKLDDITCNNRQGYLKFTGSCRNVSLSSISCIVSFTNIRLFSKMILNYLNCAYGTENVLQIPSQYIEFNKVMITTDMVLHEQTKQARIVNMHDDSVNMQPRARKMFFNNCGNIYASHNDIQVDMSTFISRSENDNVIYTTATSQFELVTIDSADFIHLMLKHFCMDGNWKLKRNAKSLELENVTSADKNTVFTIIILHELNNISITDSNICISLSHPCKLKRMSIIRSEMIYNPIIFDSVEYLSLISTKIDETLIFTDSVRIVHLEDVCIKEKVVLNQSITNLCIINVTGSVDMSMTVINCTVELKGKEVIQLEKTASEYSLNMHNVCLSSDHYLKNIQTIKLKNIMICNCTIRISDCHYVEISNFALLVIYRSNDEIKGLAERCKTNGQLVLSNINTLKLENIKLSHSIEMPSCIRTIILEQIEIIDDIHFIANQECEEIHLRSCEGTVDIRSITQLRKLAFVSPMNKCILLTNKKHLNSLHDLEIGGDVDDNFVISVLSHCNHLKRLTLHNPMLSYKYGNDEIYIEYKGNSLPFSTNNNINLLSKIFNFNMVNKLEYLDISRLFLDHKKIKILKKFNKLHTLVVNSSAIGQIPLKSIPDSINTLKCVDKYYTNMINYDSEEYVMCLHEDAKNIKHLAIKNMTLTGTLNILHYLPFHLEKLTIITSNSSHYPDKQTNTHKSCVKELVLHITSADVANIVKQKNFARRYYVETFEYLQELIDFDKLEKLAIETDTTRIYLNTRTYQII